jgi:large subunit ribosomal protein L18
MNNTKREARKIRHHRVRAKVKGSTAVPRLCVFRSLSHIYAQIIDDTKGLTLVSASTRQVKTSGKKSSQAIEVGKMVAEKAKAAGITQVVFDRGGFKYHGRVKSLADSAREAGLKF